MSNTFLIYGNKNNDLVVNEINNLIDKFTKEHHSLLVLEDYNSEIIDEIHSYINSTALEGSKKVLICYNFNECDIKLQNKLLKDIEENYDDTLQIYVSETHTNILSTIISRLLPITIKKNDLLKSFNSIDQTFLKKFNFNFEQLTFLLNNNDFISVIQNVYNSKNYDNLYLKYTVDKWTKEQCLILVNVFYVKSIEQNKFNAVKIINDYEKIFLSNAKFELQFESLLLKLKEEDENN